MSKSLFYFPSACSAMAVTLLNLLKECGGSVFRAFIVTFSSQVFCPSCSPASRAGAISPLATALISPLPLTSAEQLLSIKKPDVSIFVSGPPSPLTILCL